MKYEEVYPNCHNKLKGSEISADKRPKPEPCSQLPGTVLRVFIPAGAVINLLNLIELTSPSGICVIIRLPFLGKLCANGPDMAGLINSIKNAGGTVEVVAE
jgi:hypothetical protein